MSRKAAQARRKALAQIKPDIPLLQTEAGRQVVSQTESSVPKGNGHKMEEPQVKRTGGTVVLASDPSHAEHLISTYQLGTPRRIYKPHTILSITKGLLLIVEAIGWFLFMIASLTASPLLPSNISLSHNVHGSISYPNLFIPILLIAVGLLGIPLGAWTILKALPNRRVRAVLYTHGVVLVGREKADAFRWDQVATVSHQVVKRGYPYRNMYADIYTVKCRDKRIFVFDQVLSEVTQLGEIMKSEVARDQHERHAKKWERDGLRQ